MISVFLSEFSISFLESFTSTYNASDRIPAGYTPTGIEEKWLSIFDGRNEALTYGTVLSIFHFAIFALRFIPFVIIDQFPSLKKYKIQEDRKMTNEQWWKCVWYLVKNQVILQTFFAMFFIPIADFYQFDKSVPFPTMGTMLLQTLFFLVVEDFFHYWVHRLLHWGPLYRYVHKLHHEFPSPTGMTAEYSTVSEVITIDFGLVLGPVLYNQYIGKVHVVAMFVWIAIKLYKAIDVHSGYDFPYSLADYIPILTHTDHHDFHHMANGNNFSSSFTIWDRVFGTDDKYQVFRAKRLEERKKKLGY